jgi:hypothetical protein
MVGLLVTVLFGVALFVAVSITIEWTSHLSMTKKYADSYGWGGYREFKREFQRYQWVRSGKDLLDRSNDCQLQNDIIKFDGVGMRIHNPLSYLLVTEFIKRQCAKGRNRKYKWIR